MYRANQDNITSAYARKGLFCHSTLFSLSILILLASLPFSASAETECQPISWTGSGDTAGTISSLCELRWLSEEGQDNGAWDSGVTWTQTVDIKASDTANWNAGDHDNEPMGFSPIGNSSNPFYGTYDGDGHTISGLTINRPGQDDVGLFGYVGDGELKNIGLEGGSITGSGYVGGLVGYSSSSSSSSSITHSYVTGEVAGDFFVGGLVGYSSLSSIENSYAAGLVTGNYNVGGLVGDSYSSIENSYATGEVAGDFYVGGLVGSSSSSSSIENSYATGEVTGTGRDVGGLVGLVGYSDSSSITNSVFDCEEGGVVGEDDCGTDIYGATGLTTAQMQTQQIFIGMGWGYSDAWDNSQAFVWQQAQGSYPQLSNGNAVPVFDAPAQTDWDWYSDVISLTEDSPTTINLSVTAFNGGTLSFDVSPTRDWMILDDNQDGTATLALNPTDSNDEETVSDVSIRVTETYTDAEGNELQSINQLPLIDFDVTAVNDAPVLKTLSNPFKSMNEDGAISISTSDLATDEEGDDITFGSVSASNGAVTLAANGLSFTYKPKANWYGTDTVTFNVVDASGSNTKVGGAFKVKVNSVNDAPVIMTASLDNATQGEAYSFTIAHSDIDSGSATVEIVTAPAWLGADGMNLVSSTLSNNEVGEHQVSIKVKDSSGGVSSSKTFTLTVDNINDAPVFDTDPVTTATQDVQYSYTPTASDVDGDAVSITKTQGPTWLSMSNNVLTGTPTNDDVGSHSVVLTVSDGNGGSTSQSFTVTVKNINDAPVFSSAPVTTATQGAQYSYSPTVTDVDGDTVTITKTQGPTWLSMSNNVLTGTPSREDVGKHSVVLTASDGNGGSDSQSFTIDVESTNQAPVASNDTVTLAANEEEVYTLSTSELLANDSDPDGDELQLITATSGEAIVTLGSDSMTLALYASVNEFTVNYTIADGSDEIALTDSATVTVTIERDVEETPPTITLTESLVEVNATALLTKVELETPTATDAEGNTVSVMLVDGETHFSAGKHEVTWKAVDANGLEAIARQEVWVHPQISLAPSTKVEVADLDTYELKVTLNGESPSYPVLVPYIINASTADELVITSGTNGTIELALSGNTESVEVELLATDSSGREVNLGSRTAFTLEVVDTSMPPMVSSTVTQEGEVRSVVEADIDVNITVTHDNANTLAESVYTYEWTLNDEAQPETASTFTYAPASREQASFDVVEATVTDSATELFTQHRLSLEVYPQFEVLDPESDSDGDGFSDSEEGYADQDQDGIPDYMDAIDECSVLQQDLAHQESYLIEVESGLCIRKGTTVADNYTGGAELDLEEDGIEQDPTMPITGGLFDFEVTGLANQGDYITLVIPQTSPLPSEAIYVKYDAQTGEWNEFVEGEADGYLSSSAGESGYCPAPANLTESDEWTSGLTEGDWCVQLTIKDGGANDTDGMENGTVVDPGGVAKRMSSNTLPVANADAVEGYVNQQLEIDVLANDTDAEDDVLSIVSATANQGDALISGDVQRIIFTPPTDQIGVFTMTYGIDDGSDATVAGNVTVTISDGVLDNSSSGDSGGSGGSLGWFVFGLFGATGCYRRRKYRRCKQAA